MSTEIGNEYTKYDRMSLLELISAMSTVQSTKEAIEESLKVVNKEFDFLRVTKIPTKMEEDGVSLLNVTGIGRVSLTADMHVSVKADQRSEFFTWLRDNGRGDLLQENINPSTLKAAVKKMFREGEEVPDQLLNISPFTRASITRT